MKKLLSICVLLLLVARTARAQLSINVLDTVQMVYEDVRVAASGSSLACLKANGDFEVRTFSGNDLGTVQSTTTLTGFYEKLEIVGFYAYAVGYNLKAIDISNPAAPVPYPEIYFTNAFRSTAHWGNLLFSLSNIDGTTYKLQTFTLFYPTAPQRVDTLVMPADGDMKVSGNKLYYFWSDAATGDRIRIYTLSNTLPYVSLTDSIVLNQSTTLSLPSLDITGSQLLAKTSDSLYRFRIGTNGDLQLLARMAHHYQVFKMAAIDTNTVCYADAGYINVHQLHNNNRTAIDSLSGFAFFKSMGRLGNHIFYSGGGLTKLVHIGNDITDVGDLSMPGEQIMISPNPTSDRWGMTSCKNGRLFIYSIDGKVVLESGIVAGKTQNIDARSLPGGVYFYRAAFSDRSTAAGKLIRK